MRRHIQALLIPIFMIVVCAVLLVRDFRQEGEKDESGGPALAIVNASNGDVKRKPQKRMIWFDLKQTENLYRKDSIRTAKGSTVAIQFVNGTVIELGESSLIVIEQSKDKVAIDFVNGNVFSKGGSKGVVLRSQGLEIDASSAEVELSAEKGGPASVNVKGGKVTVESEGKSVTIAENQKGTLTKTGVGEISEIPLKLVLPERNSLTLAQGTSPFVSFTWEALKPMGGTTAVLEIALDREFKSKVKSIQATGKTQLEHVVLAVGKYFWRVNGTNDALSEVRSFEIQERTPIRLTDPSPETVVRFAKVAPHALFRWVGPPYMEQYTLEIASDSDFKNIVRSQKADGAPQAALDLDQPGDFFWRVVGGSSRLQSSQPSESRRILVKKLDKLEPPRLLSPTAGSTVVGQSDGADISFRWAQLEEASEYRVEIATDEKFHEILESATTTQSSYFWHAKRLGRLFWRVSALDLDKRLVIADKFQDLVAVSSVPIRILAPENKARIQYLSEKPKVDLRWEEEKAASGYEVEISKDLAFKESVIKKKIGETVFSPSDLGEGIFFWRARALDSSGNLFRSSQIFSFELKVKDLLAAPEMLLPASGFVQITLTPEEMAIDTSWAEVPGAQTYELTVSSRGREPSSLAKPVFSNKVRSPKARIERLPAGEYLWTVRGIDSLGRPGQLSRPTLIVVKQLPTLAPPEPLEPEVSQRRK